MGQPRFTDAVRLSRGAPRYAMLSFRLHSSRRTGTARFVLGLDCLQYNLQVFRDPSHQPRTQAGTFCALKCQGEA